jgi:hypothetical protein
MKIYEAICTLSNLLVSVLTPDLSPAAPLLLCVPPDTSLPWHQILQSVPFVNPPPTPAFCHPLAGAGQQLPRGLLSP